MADKQVIDVGGWFGAPNNQIVLDCLVFPTGRKVKLFQMNKQGYLQYSLRSDAHGDRGRPKAWRVPFLDDPNYDDNVKYTVSHLCHNPKCYNWNHHTLELLTVNKGRNGCPGGLHCHHIVKCLRPGPYYNM